MPSFGIATPSVTEINLTLVFPPRIDRGAIDRDAYSPRDSGAARRVVCGVLHCSAGQWAVPPGLPGVAAARAIWRRLPGALAFTALALRGLAFSLAAGMTTSRFRRWPLDLRRSAVLSTDKRKLRLVLLAFRCFKRPANTPLD